MVGNKKIVFFFFFLLSLNRERRDPHALSCVHFSLKWDRKRERERERERERGRYWVVFGKFIQYVEIVAIA